MNCHLFCFSVIASTPAISLLAHGANPFAVFVLIVATLAMGFEICAASRRGKGRK